MAICPECMKQELRPGERLCPRCANKKTSFWVKTCELLLMVASAIISIVIFKKPPPKV